MGSTPIGHPTSPDMNEPPTVDGRGLSSGD